MYSIHSIRQPLPVASWASFSFNYFFTSSESSTAIFPMRIYRKRLGTRLFFPMSPYRNPVSDATSHLRPLHKLQDSYLRLEKETNTKDCQKPTCWTPATASGLVAESIDLGQKDSESEALWAKTSWLFWSEHGARLTRTLRFHEEQSSFIPTNLEPSTSDVWKAGREFGFNRNLLIMTTTSFFLLFLNLSKRLLFVLRAGNGDRLISDKCRR